VSHSRHIQLIRAAIAGRILAAGKVMGSIPRVSGFAATADRISNHSSPTARD